MNPTSHSAAPYLHSGSRIDDVLWCFVFASVPAAALGIWNLGAQMLSVAADGQLGNFPGSDVLQMLGFSRHPPGVASSLIVGSVHFLPRLITAWLTAAAWSQMAARLRRAPVDPSWILCGWLLALLLPAGASLLLVMLATSFAMLFGSVVFGGTGRYLVSPAMLGAVFLGISYPQIAQQTLPLADAGTSTWHALANGGLPVDTSLLAAFIGREVGPVGATSTLAVIVGAIYLVVKGVASARTLLGAFVGLLVMTLLLNASGADGSLAQLPWYWHLSVGSLAFNTVFLACDPSATPLTATARLIQGMVIGMLTPLIRVLDPTHPDGSLYAVLLAALAVPLIDHLVLRRIIARRARAAAVTL